MNIRTLLIVLSVGILVAGKPFAQDGTGTPGSDARSTLSGDAPWHLIFFAAGEARATETINNIVRGGYIPVGMEVTAEKELGILLVKAGTYTVESWLLIDYTDWNALEAEISGGIREGYVPMDISRYDETLAVLWVKTNVALDGWRISTSPNTVSDRTKTVNDFQAQGFTLWGMSVHEGLAWYLFIRQPGMPPAGAISAFSRTGDSLGAGMLDANKNGWLPNGLATAGSTVYICFVK